MYTGALIIVIGSLLAANNHPTRRYIHVSSGLDSECALVDWTINMAISKRTTQIRTRREAKNLLSIDLAELIEPKINNKGYDPELQALLDTWEQLALREPYFLGAAIKVGPFIKRLPTKHLEKNFGKDIFDKLVTNVPVVDSRWFITQALTTLDGGLYYRFRGIPTTQNEFLIKFTGVNQEKVDQIRSDQRAGMFFSKVTGKPRSTIVYHAIGGRSSVNQGLVMITEDTKDDEGQAEKDPIRTLLDAKFDATEIIAELPNGFHVFGLFDGKGNRQNSAPDDVVKDHTVPAPYTSRLQPAISCIRCHTTDEGIKPAPNEILKLKIGILGDINQTRDPNEVEEPLLLAANNPEQLNRLLGKYAGNFDKAFERARDDYSEALTFLGSKYNTPDSKKLQTLLSDTFEEYNYKLVDEKQAISEIRRITGWQLRLPKGADPGLKILLEPIPLEDPYVRALKVGIPITRKRFEQIFADLTTRIKEEYK